MKKSNLLKLGLAAALAGSMGVVSADQTDGTATVQVLTPLTVAQDVQMNFGQVYGGTAAGTVSIAAADGVVTTTGDAGYVAGALRAQFTITGAATTAVNVVVSGGATLDDGAGGGAAMALTNDATAGLVTTALNTTGTTDGTGNLTFLVGGTLAIGASQVAGTYDTLSAGGAPYTVTVNY